MESFFKSKNEEKNLSSIFDEEASNKEKVQDQKIEEENKLNIDDEDPPIKKRKLNHLSPPIDDIAIRLDGSSPEKKLKTDD